MLNPTIIKGNNNVHPIEPHLPALTRYSKKLCRGITIIDHKDLVQEAVLLALKNEKNDLRYLMWACKIRFIDTYNHYKKFLSFTGPIGKYTIHFQSDPILDAEHREEHDILLEWASSVIAQRCPRGENTKERDRERRKKYLKEYRKNKKNEEQRVAA